MYRGGNKYPLGRASDLRAARGWGASQRTQGTARVSPHGYGGHVVSAPVGERGCVWWGEVVGAGCR